ncbi:hypothetical protein RN001_012479 [Aquatica leii]|uniref:SET domain-containing protein n=1 Tax=Aquatica leii TaxID=1421715 RepID=A0AAN7P3X7_9COLE|nr:hypothetical protein RN001_012479 [Aquatica leii]
MPESAAYRKYTEQIICERAQILNTSKNVEEIENAVCCGQVEELIVQAENELMLARKMLNWKPWEKLVQKPPAGKLSDLETSREITEDSGVNASSPNVVGGDAKIAVQVMSVCLETNTVLPNSSNTTSELVESGLATPTTLTTEHKDVSQSVAKLVITSSACNTSSVLQKVPTSSVITVVNATGPLTILKTLCSNSCGGATAPQFTLVNSSPLNVCNAAGKPITVVGAPPITVVRAISNISSSLTQAIEDSTKSTDGGTNTSTLPMAPERPPVHNVFVKNTITSDLVPAETPTKVQKISPVSYSPNNVTPLITTGNLAKTVNGQKPTTPGMTTNSKLKIVSNILTPPVSTIQASTSSTSINASNVILNKSQPKNSIQQKIVNNSLNGTSKFMPRASTLNSFQNKPTAKTTPAKTQKLLYPAHKSQLKTIPPVPNSISKPGIKTLTPQARGILNQHVQRTSSGLRTIPPQRSPKISNKPNYIGKHAIQAQKFKNSHTAGRPKSNKPLIPTVNVFPNRTPQNTGVTYHQALTANILQSLSENSNNVAYNRTYDFGSRYDNCQTYTEPRNSEPTTPTSIKPQSNLEALSFVCQAVLLDHNYNATPPSDSVNRSVPTTSSTTQLNGGSANSYYSPTSNTRIRSTLGGSTNTLSTLSSNSATSLLPSNSSVTTVQDDDAASDISCGSERKLETEGEETDTAPEAEAVNNEDNYDHYGDYVTRCICGFLHDDGYMIECDKCKVWQHVRCVIKSNKKVPDDYLCEVCDPNKPVDRGKARSLQQQWMRDNQEREAKLRKEARLREIKLKESMSDSDSSDGEVIGGSLLSKSRLVSNNRRKMEQTARINSRQRRDSAKTEVKRNVKRKERKSFKKKAKPTPKSQSDDETQETWPHTSISQMPQLRQWIEHYEDAVTNHYSPELRARISNIRINGVHSDLSSQIDNSVHKCRIYTQPLTGLKYLVSTVHLAPNTPVVELRGKYMLSTQHRTSSVGHSGSLTTRQHAQRPGPFLFFYRLHKDNTEVCVDTRTYGNEARFIRRSCKPNSELRHCIEKGVLHLYIVTIINVEKNSELTIKHESHDLAIVGTTHVSCACGNPSECCINKGSVKNNGETPNISQTVRKRRGRRIASITLEPTEPIVLQTPKEEPPPSPVEIKQEMEIKQEVEEIKVKEEFDSFKVEEEYPLTIDTSMIKEEPTQSLSPPPSIVTRKAAQCKSDTEDKKESHKESCSSSDKRKLSREERKIEAIMKAFERMEKQEQRRQEHQAKQAHRRESEPCPSLKDEDLKESKIKRRRRKGRARTVSTNSQARQNRLNSSDSLYATSGDECMLSPTDSIHTPSKDICDNSPHKDVGLLTTCENSNRSDLKSPIPNVDCNSNSANSSPETPLSSACLLVAAAVEPLEPNFKFPKTKKGLMNEWINKSTECVQSASSISPSSLTPHIVPVDNYYETSSNNNFFTPSKNLVALAQAANYCDLPTQSLGNAKKRWLRQAISEDQCDSPSSRPESPPLPEMVPPPKKRRLPRESLSAETSPPSTPTNFAPALNGSEDAKRYRDHEDRVEIVTPRADGDSPTRVIIDDATLKERVAEMQQEIGSCFRLPEPIIEVPAKEVASSTTLRCTLDPRLSRPIFNTSDHLVATVEKNLSMLGFEEKVTNVTPTKRKLSINEYRQRKQLTLNEKLMDEPISEENTSSQSPPQKLRTRSSSNSSETSFMSSDEEFRNTELPQKALSAFNSEPTELEKQRESVSLRLKKAFGLSIDEDTRKPPLNMDAILNCDLDSTKSLRGYSSTASACSESNSNPVTETCVDDAEVSTAEDTKTEVVSETGVEQDTAVAENNCEMSVESTKDDVNPEMFYTPDEEDLDKVEKEDVRENDKSDEYVAVESTNYVPPFNNPVYPNSSFTSFGSVIDDETRYEGRNPSPPPEMTNVSVSYSSP